MEWCPPGETFVTATTAPRLRMGNGFKVWHYSGALLHETVWAEGQELLEVVWQKYAEGTFQEKPITNAKVQGILPSQPVASKAIYIPPNARPGGAMAYSPRSVPDARGPIPGMPPGMISYRQSQGQLKKQRNGNKKRNPTDSPTNGTPPQTSNHHVAAVSNGDHRSQQTGEPNDQQQQAKRRPNNRNQRNGTPAAFTTGDPEKDKRIKVVQKKLKEIVSLKARKEKGENLEANQLSKINLEIELSQELSTLRVSA